MLKNNCLKFLFFFSLGCVLGILVFKWISSREELPPLSVSLSHQTEKENPSEKTFSTSTGAVSKKVEVDLSRQKLLLFEDGKVIKEISISSGKEETPTPTGNFRVIYKTPVAYSKIADCWLPFWVGFTFEGGYGFHEVPICEGERVGQEEIGQPASLGCVRLKMSDAERFYNWVEIETPVEIYE